LFIKEVLTGKYEGQQITVCGWVRTKRESKGLAFLTLSDGSAQDTLQLVVPGESSAVQELYRCNTGAAICTKGILKESPAKEQKYELEVSEIAVFGEADPEK